MRRNGFIRACGVTLLGGYCYSILGGPKSEEDEHTSGELGKEQVVGIRTLMTGLGFGESPRWHNDRLWFSNWGTREIVATDITGKSEVMINTPFASFPYCIDWLHNGQLLLVSTSDQPFLRVEPGGSFVRQADLSAFKGFTWNEIVVDGRENIYLNGGPMNGPGIIALVDRGGRVRAVADGLSFPNGMAITPDNSTLIVAESFGSKLTAFDIAEDGTLGTQRTWADLNTGVPDGICLDAEGAVWYGDVPNKCCVKVREGGEVLQTIPLDLGCFACMLGGKDRKSLFMLAALWPGFDKLTGKERTGKLIVTDASVAGVGWP